jgi:hypothetical protein
MASDAPEKKDVDGFDVVLLHGKTTDGEGACVLRARPGKLEAGEVRPLREGRPIAGGGEVVRLSPRAGMPNLFDVDVQCVLPSSVEAQAIPAGGPPQVATRAYRESWERTFGPAPRKALSN